MRIQRIQDIDNWENLFKDFITELANEEENAKAYLDVKWQEKITKYGEILTFSQNQVPKIIGWILIYCNEEKTLTAYCAGFNVLKRYRGGGIGKELLVTAIELCTKRKFKALTLYCDPTNEVAFKMYKQFGFKETDTIKNNLILMELKL